MHAGILGVGSRARAQITFGAAGTGGEAGLGISPISVPYPSGIAAGHILVVHLFVAHSGAAAASTPSGWSDITSTTGGVSLRAWAFIKIATGSESGSLDISYTGDIYANARMYRFSAGLGFEAASSSRTAASGTTFTPVSVTTTASLGMAVQLFGCNSGGGTPTVSAVTGETGGDYTEAVAEYASISGFSTLSCQVATMASAGTISGGTATINPTNTDRLVIGFGLKA